MDSERLRVLIAEDHRDLAANLSDFLTGRGHHVELAYDGLTALHLAATLDVDALVLDVMLPGVDGLTVCRRFRESTRSAIPILVLTARDTLAEKLEGFRAGCDDYVTKPFSLDEVEARLLALVRRSRPNRAEPLRVDDLELDLGTRIVRRAGQAIDLGPSLVVILTELMKASPNVVKRQRLESLLWGNAPPASDALRSQVYLLRHAIDRPFDRPLLRTVHGVGYRIVGSNEK